MTFQQPILNRGINNYSPDGHTTPYQQQNRWNTLNTCTYYQTVLIFLLILLFLLLRKVKNDKQLVSMFVENPSRKVVKTKILLPIRLPVLDTIYAVIKLRKDGLKFLEQLFEQYGNLFELPFGPLKLTVVSDPAIIQKILTSSQMAHLNRPKVFNSFLRQIFANGLLTSENEIWSGQRKMLSRSFTYNSLQNFAVFMNTHAANLAEKLIHECKNKNGIEVHRFNQLLSTHTFKIISRMFYLFNVKNIRCSCFQTNDFDGLTQPILEIVMGTDNISTKESEEIAVKFNRGKNLLQEELVNPWYFLRFLAKKRELDHVCKDLNNFFEKMTQLYKREYEQTKIISASQKSSKLDKDCSNEDDGVGVKPFRCMIEEMLHSGASNEEIRQQVGTILATGHDTTTLAIKMLMMHLAVNFKHQIACREEIDQVINTKGSQYNANSYTKAIKSFDFKMEDLHDLKYLERCILESGRITSIVPVFTRRLDAPLKTDDNLEFPAGTTFAISNWMLHRDPQIYPDPLKFDPDRFLSENVKNRHPYSYTPFSLGPRNCIGWKVAIMEIKVIMAYILRHFEIFTDDKFENVKLNLGLTVIPERDYKLVLKRRKYLNM